jgi:hypothetical protein
VEDAGVVDPSLLFHFTLLRLPNPAPPCLTGVCRAREKKDIIQFTNGDRITCEIIKQQKGCLYVKLDYADGTVVIDWSKIARVESSQSFVVADKTGRRYTGNLQTVTEGEAPEELNVQVTGLPQTGLSKVKNLLRSTRQKLVFGRTCTARLILV